VKTEFYGSEVSEGDFLGGYQVLNVLGRGMHGTTFHVLNNVQDKEFVLKTFPLSLSKGPEWLGRLEAQTSLLSRISSSNFDRIVESGRSGNLWFCVKDFVHDGEGFSCNLRDYTKRFGSKLTHYQTVHLALQVLETLDQAHHYQDAHHRGFCHGNLKPENILISSCGQKNSANPVPFELKLTDFQPYSLFDHALILKSYQQWEDRLRQHSTVNKEEVYHPVLTSLYRSFDYLAPELAQGGNVTVQSDLYALGMILYEALTGELPSGRVLSVEEMSTDVPKEWNQVLQGCLQAKPEARYTSAIELSQRIKEIFDVEERQSFAEEAWAAPAQAGKIRTSLTPPGMVYIPAGSFFVGGDEGGEDALPQHECSTEGFYMDRTPVTVGQFKNFVKETGYITEAEEGAGAPLWLDGNWRVMDGVSWKHPSGDRLPEDFSQHPVTQLSSKDARAYAEWKDCRLPTEKEWEYAARGGQKDVRFPWGNKISRSNANYGSEGTCAVMHYHGNGYGLFDMSGNVWEWTASYYLAYPGNCQENPHFGEQYFVLRGGCWLFDGSHCSISFRNASLPTAIYPTVGFRCVKDFV
jgi:sulfatase modifying factor 1